MKIASCQCVDVLAVPSVERTVCQCRHLFDKTESIKNHFTNTLLLLTKTSKPLIRLLAHKQRSINGAVTIKFSKLSITNILRFIEKNIDTKFSHLTYKQKHIDQNIEQVNQN